MISNSLWYFGTLIISICDALVAVANVKVIARTHIGTASLNLEDIDEQFVCFDWFIISTGKSIIEVTIS